MINLEGITPLELEEDIEQDELPIEPQQEEAIQNTSIENIDELPLDIENEEVIAENNTLANFLTELFELQQDDVKDITTVEDAVKLFKELDDKRIDAYFDELDNKTNGAISYLMKNGSLEGFSNNSSTEFMNMSENDLNDNTAERVLREFYKLTKRKEDYINKSITKLKTNDLLIDEAKEVLSEVKDYYTELDKNKKEDIKKQRDMEVKKVKEYMTNITEKAKNIKYDGVEITDKMRTKLDYTRYGSISEIPVIKKINTQLDKYLPVLTMLDELGVLESPKYFMDKAESIKTKEVVDKVKGSSNSKKGTSTTTNSPITQSLAEKIAKRYNNK